MLKLRSVAKLSLAMPLWLCEFRAAACVGAAGQDLVFEHNLFCFCFAFSMSWNFPAGESEQLISLLLKSEDKFI